MKRIGSLLFTIALVATLAIPAAAASFKDIPAGSTLADEIQKANDYGLMQGYNSTWFGYSQKITRAQFAAVLVRMFGWEKESGTAAIFTDVPVSHTWYQVIKTAAVHNVVDSGGKFRPDDSITRAEMSEMLVRALGLKSAAALASKDSLPFTDVAGSNKGYVAVAYAIGMTNGTTASTFSPGTAATRAQAAAMMVRIYEKYTHHTDWTHGFYAISSYSQLSLADQMDAVSAGWSRMTWDGSTATLSTTSSNGNEYYIPNGYDSVTSHLENNGTSLNLSVYMDASGSVKEMLASSAGRSQAVAQIVNELSVSYKAIGKNPYAGVTIDFEGLYGAQKSSFSAFLTALSTKVHALGKTLYVCVCPALTTGSYYDGYDYRTIGTLADKVILMAYDYNPLNLTQYVGTAYYKTAATTPIDQIYESLRAITNSSTGVQDRSKIAMGFSCKNVAWKIDGSGKLLSGTPVYPSNATVLTRLAQSDTVTGWSDTYQQSYATYSTADGGNWFMWYESSASVAAKMKLAKLFGIDRVSIWRIGIIPDTADWDWTSTLLK